MAVILSDPRGQVLHRRAGRSVMRALDRVLLAPGYLYSEGTVGTNAIGTAAQDGASAWVVGSEHYAEWLRDLSCAGAVIRHPLTGRIEGVLDLTCYLKDTNPLMMPFVDQAAREIERRLRDDVPQADQELLHTIRMAEARAVGEERRRLARELHDSVSQALFGIKLGVDRARDLLARAPDELAEPLEYVRVLAAAGLADVRALMGELRSESTEKKLELVMTITRQMAAVETHHGVAVTGLLPTREPEASLETKETLLRICQEALHNVVKHARATTVRVRLQVRDADLLLDITDDGVGFDGARELPGHFGLGSMRERALGVGGAVEIVSAPGRGTRVTARVPSSPRRRLR
jgi:signal transduction histidine kinase